MTTLPQLSRGRRHILASAALEQVRAGVSTSDALTNAIAGKPVTAEDREAIEAELHRLVGAEPLSPEDAAALVPDDDGSLEEGPVIAPPGTAERTAEVERIASGAAKPERAKGERRSLEERRAEAVEGVASARFALTIAESKLRKIDLLEIADLLATDKRGAPAARMIRTSVHAGFIDQALPYVVTGARAVGYTVDEGDIGESLDRLRAAMIEAAS